jgi:hypothetical protein
MEIERILSRYGAYGFMYGWQDTAAIVAFDMNNRRIKFLLPMPDKNDREFTHTKTRETERHPKDALAAWEQAGRQKWRALALAIKAKLEAVESGITEFEEEFMAHIVLPDGKTVGQHMGPQITYAYEQKRMPKLLGYIK